MQGGWHGTPDGDSALIWYGVPGTLLATAGPDYVVSDNDPFTQAEYDFAWQDIWGSGYEPNFSGGHVSENIYNYQGTDLAAPGYYDADPYNLQGQANPYFDQYGRPTGGYTGGAPNPSPYDTDPYNLRGQANPYFDQYGRPINGYTG
jgi:hypothetical protein